MAKRKKQSVGTVDNIDICDELKQSYLAYAMSVILDRALPDLRDGLKPSQRRILYTMRNVDSYVKSARIVGEVLGTLHP